MSGRKDQGLLKKISFFLSYRPPQHDTFILPELENEESYRVTPENRSNMDYEGPGDSGKVKGKEKKKKKPVKASQWNTVKYGNGNDKDQIRESQISTDIKISLELTKKEFNIPSSVDCVIREFKLNGNVDAFIVFIDGMADRNVINNFILRQLMNPRQFEKYTGGSIFEYVKNNVLSVNQIKDVKNYKEAFDQALLGLTIFFIDGYSICLAIETRGFEKRNVEKPVTEAVVSGSQEGFTENVKTSTIQIRRIIKNKNLINEYVSIGAADHSGASIMYIKGIANPAVVREVKRRIKSINTDFIGGNGMLEQFIEDNSWMLIPQVLTTERPDRTASHLMEGRVAILADGSPFAIIVPISIFNLIHSPEDSYLRWQYGTALRFLRLFAIFIALLLPAIYLSLINYHQEMLPTDLLIAIAASREAVPFPSIVEVLLMEVSFELIREAGIRVPGIIGTTLGIIGALILGQAAVAANIVSPILIIIVAVTGLGNFVIPNYSLAFGIRLFRFFFIFLGATLGFFGISVGLVMTVALVCSIKSFGVPFLTPGWPFIRSSDTVIRAPAWEQEERPDDINAINKRRQTKIARGWIREGPPVGESE